MQKRSSSSYPLSAAMLTALLAVSTGQAQSLQRIEPITFRTPDGSRFILFAAPEVLQVHWCVATPAGAAEEPRGLAGLATAVQHASLNGSRTVGSRDPAGEAAALEALDRAYAEVVAKPGDAQATARLLGCQRQAQLLGDRSVMARVLAALPAHDPDILVRDPVAMLRITTVAAAIGEVGALLVDRRENPVLRGLDAAWLSEATRRHNAQAGDPLAAVHAELLALALPSHPAAQAADGPGRLAPRRAQSLAVWNATQHPRRAVHVLFGNFDPVAARKVLLEVFATTRMPDPAPVTAPAPQPFRSQRRSTVPGTGRNMVALAWVLPPIEDSIVLEAAAAWLGGGPESQLGRRLRRADRKTASVTCMAPWPLAIRGRSLLLVEVADPAGAEGLADFVLTATRELTAKPPTRGSLYPTAMRLQRNWSIITAEPRLLADETARQAMLWPGQTPSITRSPSIDPVAVHKLLVAVFAGKPVIVEARP